MQNPTLRAAFRGALAYVFAARRAWGLSRSSSWPRARPAAASAVAIPLPMPLDAPLTTATLPVSLLIVLSLPWCRCAAGDARRQFLPGTWTIMLTVVSDLNTRTSNGERHVHRIPKNSIRQKLSRAIMTHVHLAGAIPTFFLGGANLSRA